MDGIWERGAEEKRGMSTGQERNKKEMKEGFREWKGGELHKKAINNKVPPTLMLITNVYICSSPLCKRNLVILNHVSIISLSLQDFIVHQTPLQTHHSTLRKKKRVLRFFLPVVFSEINCVSLKLCWRVWLLFIPTGCFSPRLWVSLNVSTERPS